VEIGYGRPAHEGTGSSSNDVLCVQRGGRAATGGRGGGAEGAAVHGIAWLGSELDGKSRTAAPRGFRELEQNACLLRHPRT